MARWELAHSPSSNEPSEFSIITEMNQQIPNLRFRISAQTQNDNCLKILSRYDDRYQKYIIRHEQQIFFLPEIPPFKQTF